MQVVGLRVAVGLLTPAVTRCQGMHDPSGEAKVLGALDH